MLDFVYYPVSAVLWFWHNVFAFAFGSSANSLSWSLAVVFLVITVRLVLLKPFLMQLDLQRKSQRLLPQIEALRKKHGSDKRLLAIETQKLHKENGSNPMLGCLPALIQAPVFIGLLHVLRSFNRTGVQSHVPFMAVTDPMSVAQNASTANYVFGPGDVQSFLDARLFGAPLSAVITTPIQQLAAFGGDVDRLSIMVVAIPMMALAAVATYFTARAAAARNVSTTPQTSMVNKLMMGLAPAGVLVSGPFLPVAVLLYWITNNGWTFVQQHIVIRRVPIDAPIPAKKPVPAGGPLPGARPNGARSKKRRR